MVGVHRFPSFSKSGRASALLGGWGNGMGSYGRGPYFPGWLCIGVAFGAGAWASPRARGWCLARTVQFISMWSRSPRFGGAPLPWRGRRGEQRLFTHSPWRVATWCVVALWRTNSLRLPSSGSIREALCGREVGVLPLQLQWVTRVILAPEEYEKKENSNDPLIGWLLIGDGLLPPL